MSKVATCEVRSREKIAKNKPQKKSIMVNSEKKWTYDEPHLTLNEKT